MSGGRGSLGVWKVWRRRESKGLEERELEEGKPEGLEEEGAISSSQCSGLG